MAQHSYGLYLRRLIFELIRLGLAYVVMPTFIVMAYIVMAHIVMANMVMACRRGVAGCGASSGGCPPSAPGALAADFFLKKALGRRLLRGSLRLLRAACSIDMRTDMRIDMCVDMRV